MELFFDFIIFALLFNLFYQAIFKYLKTKSLKDLNLAFSYLLLAFLHSRTYILIEDLNTQKLIISLGMFVLFFLISTLSKYPDRRKANQITMLSLPLFFIPTLFLAVSSFYAIYSHWSFFNEKKRLYMVYYIFSYTTLTFAAFTLMLGYHYNMSKLMPYYILVALGVIFLFIGEHTDLRTKNIRQLSNIASNICSFLLAFTILASHTMLLLFTESRIDLLRDHFLFLIALFIILHIIFSIGMETALRDNIASQLQTLGIIRDIQAGKVPEPPPGIDRANIAESQSIPNNLYKISSIIKKHQDSSADQLNKLKEVDRLRAEFLRNVSHELRTPLTIILGYINLISIKLQKENLNQLHTYSEHVRAQASILQRLVENILLFSKMEKKTMELYISLIDVPSILEKLLNEYEPIINHMDITVVKKVTPFKIYGDYDKIYTVFRELLSNATKFTPKGGNILIKSEIYEQQDQDIARFIFQDSGIGIPEEKIEISFQKFKQIDGDANREYGGTGMGLPLCKGIVELHNGRISIKSRENQGTRVTVDIPQKKGIIKRVSVPEIPKDLDPGKNYFLIIEDDPLIGDLITSYLEMRGIIGIQVNSGKYVNKFINSVRPVGCTLDLNLPDMDGWKVYETIKSNKHSKDIPVIIITEDDDKSYALKKGISMYLSKPIDKQTFDSCIDKILSDQS